MGQKVSPIGLRLCVNKTWDSRWIANKAEYATLLDQDFQVRNYVKKTLSAAGIAKVIVERPTGKVIVSIHAARPGILIGKKGSDIEKLKKKLAKIVKTEVSINVVEVRKPELDAGLAAEGIAKQLEQRVSFRRAMKRAMQSALRLGAKGIRVNSSGRLAGADIARMEWYREGRVPLHTLRSDIDYGTATAHTTYGATGVKVWIYKGEISNQEFKAQLKGSK